MRKQKRTNIRIKLLLIVIIFSGSLWAKTLIVPSVRQEQNEWCWAAVSNAVFTYYGQYHPQCEIANYTRMVCTWHDFGAVNCCSDPTQGCNYWNYMYGTPGSINDILIHWGVNNNPIVNYLSKSQVTNEINKNRPYIIRWGWTGGGGHFVVGHGIDNGTVDYMDPWQGEGYKTASYDWVRSGGNHTWTHSIKLTSNVGSVVIVMTATRQVEEAWIIRAYYGKIDFRIQNTGSKVISTYTVRRKAAGGQYQKIADIPADQVANNSYTYLDKFIAYDTVYYYKINAKDSTGTIVGSSNPYPVGE